LAQLGKIDHIIAEKRRIAAQYHRALEGIPGVQGAREEEWAHNVYWMYAIVIGSEFGLTRDELATALHGRGIETRTFFYPMSEQPCLKALPGFRTIPCPVADELWRTGMYLPSTYTLSNNSIEQICKTIASIQQSCR